MKTIPRNKIKDAFHREILEAESHHDHEIVNILGIVRWKQNAVVNGLIHTMDLNEVIRLLNALGFDKNSEVYRKLYRDMGVSLNTYYDVFYWDVNNEKAAEYRRPISEQDLKDADLRAKGRNKSDDRLSAGRHYLMGVQPDELTVEDCLQAFGWTRDGVNEAN